jgi:hypothetical protein
MLSKLPLQLVLGYFLPVAHLGDSKCTRWYLTRILEAGRLAPILDISLQPVQAIISSQELSLILYSILLGSLALVVPIYQDTFKVKRPKKGPTIG